MNQSPTIDRWYAITILCFNVVFPVVTIFAARSAAKTEADAPEVLRKHHRVLLWAHIAGFTLIATVPALLTWAGLLPSVGTMGVRLFDFVTEGWKRQAGLTGFALAVSGASPKTRSAWIAALWKSRATLKPPRRSSRKSKMASDGAAGLRHCDEAYQRQGQWDAAGQTLMLQQQPARHH